LGANLYKITAIIKNVGYLPTYMTQRALKHQFATPVTAALDITDGVELLMGAATQDLGHLAGRDERTATWSPWMREWHTSQRKVEWLVRASAGTTLTITAQAQRAGTQRQKVTLA
jgi:hypothetical protein